MTKRIIAITIFLGTISFSSSSFAQIDINSGSSNLDGVVSSAIACSDAGGFATKKLDDIVKNVTQSKTVKTAKSLGIGAVSGAAQAVATSDANTQEKLKQQLFKEECLDKIANGVAKQQLAKATARTLNWVNTGFGGNPFYVLNQNQYFKSIADQEIKSYLGTLPQKNSVFGNDIRNIFVEELTGKTSTIGTTESYEREKLEAFNDDFRNGGWDMWRQTIDGSYNPITAYFQETNKISSRINNTTQAVQGELNQGNGFLSQKKCVKYEQVNQTAFDEMDPNTPDLIAQLETQDRQPRCLEWKTVVPGTLIAEMAKNSLTTTFRQLEAADELNEILGVFFSKLLNNLFDKGLGSLGSYTTADYSMYGGPGTNAIGGVTRGMQIDAATGAGTVNIKNPGSIKAVIKNQYDYLSAASDSAKALERIPASLGQLDYCLPGPRPGWDAEFSESMVPFLQAVINAKKDGKFHDIAQVTITDPTTGIPITKPGFGIQTQSNFSAAVGWVANLFNQIPFSENGQGLNSLFVRITETSYIAGQFLKFFDTYAKEINEKYTADKIAEEFAQYEAPANKAYTRNVVKASLLETQGLLTTYDNASKALADYEKAKITTTENIHAVEEIYNEALAIVTAARNRHLQKMAQEGYTVKMDCLDAMYDIDPNYTVRQRKESDAQDPNVNAAINKHREFYNNVSGSDLGNGAIQEYIDITL